MVFLPQGRTYWTGGALLHTLWSRCWLPDQALTRQTVVGLVQVSIRTAEVLAEAVLARVPFGGASLASQLAGAHLSAHPSLPVRAMRQGLHMAYGSTGAVTGIGQAMLHVPRLLLKPASEQ